jgi:hypothetical protein
MPTETTRRNLASRMSLAFAAVALAAAEPAVANNAASGIVGIWRAHEPAPGGTGPGARSTAEQTLTLRPDGRYERAIDVQPPPGAHEVAGHIVDSGTYRFVAPDAFSYRRASWIVCVFPKCQPGQAVGPDSATVRFRLTGNGHADFLKLHWTKKPG